MGMIKLPIGAIDFFKDNQDKVFESGALAEGSWNQEVQKYIVEYTDSKSALATSSNGTGLLSVLHALKYGHGYDDIFLQSNTMYGMKTLAISSGLNLAGFVDCELKTLMPSLKSVQRFVDNLDSPEKSIFLLTHIGGWANPEIKEIANYCHQNNIALVEDCAHSLGTTLGGRHTGTYGVAGVYSLYATKAIPVGEGGIVIMQDEEFGDQIQRYSIYDRFQQTQNFGINNRMSEINALLTYSVLQYLDDIIENKYLIANQYIEACSRLGIHFFDPTADGQRSNLYKFILFDDQAFNFDQLNTKTSPVYDYSLGNDPEDICSKHICLPIWYGLEQKEIDKVISEMEQV